MPNWCTNRVTLTGPAEEIDRFLTQAKQPYTYVEFDPIIFAYGWDPKGHKKVPERKHRVKPDVISFQNFVPMPDTMHIPSPAPTKGPIAAIAKENLEKYGSESWYDWACANWGTKWDAGDVLLTRFNPRIVELTFVTAWGPPGPVVEAIHEQFPKLSIRLSWREEGGSRGSDRWKGDPNGIPTLEPGEKRKKYAEESRVLKLAHQIIDDQKARLRTAGQLLLGVQKLTESDTPKMGKRINDCVNHANVCIERADCSDPLELEEKGNV